jgi:mannose-6-phosphate isomerase-like protein (cupin superfamily)
MVLHLAVLFSVCCFQNSKAIFSFLFIFAEINETGMKVLKFDEVPYEKVREGHQRKMIYTDHLMTVINDFSHGPWREPEPFHSHPHEQTLYMAEGEVIFYCEDEPEQHLNPGDMVAIPSGRKHTIKLLTPEARLVDSFTPIREDFLM